MGEPICGCGSCVLDLAFHWPFRVGAGPTPCTTVSYTSPSPLLLTIAVPLTPSEEERFSAAVWERHNSRVRVKRAIGIMVAVSLVYPTGATPDRSSLTCAHWPDPDGSFSLLGHQDVFFPEVLILSPLRPSVSESVTFFHIK